MLRLVWHKLPASARGFILSAYRSGRRLLFQLFGRTSAGRRWIFARFEQKNLWGDPVSVSGPGSNWIQTEAIRQALPVLFAELRVQRLLDIPCGDGNWIRTVNQDLEQYIGADIVTDLIAGLRAEARANEQFLRLDVVSDALPLADAVLCRDVLVHPSYDQGLRALENIRRSGARYLIATTFPGRANREGVTGGWRPLDLSVPPFDLGAPLRLIDERCTEGDGAFADKSLGVWSLSPDPDARALP